MPPRRSTRTRDPSYEESLEHPATSSKRRGGAARDTPPKKTRTTNRLRIAESSTPSRRATRSTSASTVTQTPNASEMAPPKRAVMARRTGGRPIPGPPIASQRASRFGIVPPKHPKRPRSASVATEESNELDDGGPSPPRSIRPRTRRVQRDIEEGDEEWRDGGHSEVEVIDMASSDGSVGAAGPGPRTSRNRAKLRPVPQPSPSAFHKYAEKPPRTSQVESIEDPDSSPNSSLGLETQVRKPRRKHGTVGGTVLEIFDDDDDDEMDEPGVPASQSEHHSPEKQHSCRWQGCDAAFATSDELLDHMGFHLSSEGAVTSARRHSVAVPTALSSQGADGARTLDFLTGELERARTETADLQSQLAQVKTSNDELRERAKTNEELRAQVLAEAAVEHEKKLQVAADEHENDMKAASKELDGVRAELDKRIEETSELEAMVKATEAELMRRNTTMAELEAEVVELKSKAKTATDDPDAPSGTAVTLPPDAPPEEQIKERDTIIANLRKDLKRSKKAHKTTKGDLEFIRAQYETASLSAVQEVNRAKELEAEVTKLREQLSMGLKQRDLFYKAAVDAANLDAEKAKQQFVLLLEQNRRTDDGIRRKAAQHHQLCQDKHQLEMDLHKERTRAHDLSKRNDDLVALNARLRGRLMGAFDKVDESDDEDEHATEPKLAMPTLVPDGSRVVGGVADPTLTGEAQAWQCKWQVDDRLCGLYFDSREELDGHGQGVHISALEQS
ncbi:hypothetical protein CcaverHIS631_0407190 [Cutaneotrichosporon cavernicola]|nr:hypothetical protein CcaverHIS631_0407190 [Cutaneotrichosporon cavernicola]BEJ07451.1 hypothetical protein CcaverHIS641_0407200 [Cutaneotrichosporon cavernicola]